MDVLTILIGSCSACPAQSCYCGQEENFCYYLQKVAFLPKLALFVDGEPFLEDVQMNTEKDL